MVGGNFDDQVVGSGVAGTAESLMLAGGAPDGAGGVGDEDVGA